jgi:hypothetical protein
VRRSTRQLGVLLTTCLVAGLFFGLGGTARAGYVAVQVKKTPTSSSLVQLDTADLSADALSGSSMGMAPAAPANEKDQGDKVRELPTAPAPVANSTPPGAGAPSSGSSGGATSMPVGLIVAPSAIPQALLISRLDPESGSWQLFLLASRLFRPPRGV